MIGLPSHLAVASDDNLQPGEWGYWPIVADFRPDSVRPGDRIMSSSTAETQWGPEHVISCEPFQGVAIKFITLESPDGFRIGRLAKVSIDRISGHALLDGMSRAH